jgi:hypothetical protein
MVMVSLRSACRSTAFITLALAAVLAAGCGAQPTAVPPAAPSLPAGSPVSSTSPATQPSQVSSPTAPAAQPTLVPSPTVAAVQPAPATPAAGATQDTGAAAEDRAVGGKGQEIENAAIKTTVFTQPAEGGKALQIWVENVKELYAVDMEIRFDAGRLQVADADPGTDGVQIKPGQVPNPDFVATNSADNRQGVIRYVVTQLGSRPGFGGKGLIATINWQGNAGQAAAVTFSKVVMVSQSAQPIDVKVKK